MDQRFFAATLLGGFFRDELAGRLSFVAGGVIATSCTPSRSRRVSAGIMAQLCVFPHPLQTVTTCCFASLEVLCVFSDKQLPGSSS